MNQFSGLQNGVLFGNVGHGRRIHNRSYGRCVGTNNCRRSAANINHVFTHMVFKSLFNQHPLHFNLFTEIIIIDHEFDC